MTTTESIVPSLEMCKKLKEAGWPQDDAVWYWVGHMLNDKMQPTSWTLWPREKEEYREQWKPHIHAAPTAEEILRRLPDEIPINAGLKGSDYWIEIAKSSHWGSTPWEIRYRENGTLLLWDNPEPIRAATLANAAAAMYCYLAEQKLLPST